MSHSPAREDRAPDEPQRAGPHRATAPPIVHETLREPGTPLDGETRAAMDASFGYDFGGVRVHADDRAARSAESVGAAAYSVGNDIAFARGAYRPDTPAGRQLLAHELAHVTQHGDAAVPATLPIGATEDSAEREADAMAGRVAAPGAERAAPARSVAPARGQGAVLRRTGLGALIGGGIGALGGAVIGGLLGGPIGALVGGLIGLVAGGIVGEVATTDSRSLTAEEIAYAKEIYVDSIDYRPITITRDSVLAVGAPRTIGNTIHLKSSWGHFKGDTLELTEQGQLTLIHEMGHVWQYQNAGLDYIPLSLAAQLGAVFSGESRDAAYNWRTQHDANVPWEDWNPEQQAGAIEDYNRLLRQQKTNPTSMQAEDIKTLSILVPYIEKVRRREGAPTIPVGVLPSDEGYP